MIVGYARLSEHLRAAGAERVFAEQGSEARDDRSELPARVSSVRAGNTPLLVALDWLGRSTRHLVRTVDELRARNVDLRLLRGSLDISTPTGQVGYWILPPSPSSNANG